MKASETIAGKWYKWGNRIVARLPGEAKVIEGRLGVPAKFVDAPIGGAGGYLPVEEEVTEYKLNFVRIT